MSALVASLALVHALSRSTAPTALVTQPITCTTNANISDSGCGNTGWGNSGWGNNGTGNSGTTNTGTGNSGLSNTGNGNSGEFNVGNGNSGCGNTGVGNSGGGNVGAGDSGGISCSAFTAPTTVPITTVTTTIHPGIPTASTVTPAPIATLPLTGRNSEAPLELALGLMVTGAAAVGLANRRRHALAASTGGELIPLSAAVGLLLTGRAKPGAPRD